MRSHALEIQEHQNVLSHPLDLACAKLQSRNRFSVLVFTGELCSARGFKGTQLIAGL